MKLELLGIVLAVLAAGAGDARMPAKVGVAGAEASQLEGRVPGNAVSCLPLFTLGSSDASDGRIVFHGSSSRTLHVNVPKSGSDLLNDDVYLVVRTPSSSLCRSDIVWVVDRVSRFERGAVVLGDFVPWVAAARR